MFRSDIRRICPFLDMFHIYKKMLENIWSQPELFRTFLAPLMHAFYPNSVVKKKPQLKQIELTLTCCRLAYPKVRDALLFLNDMALEPKIKTQYTKHYIYVRIPHSHGMIYFLSDII